MTADSTTLTTSMDVLEPLRAAPARHLTDLMEGAAATGAAVAEGAVTGAAPAAVAGVVVIVVSVGVVMTRPPRSRVRY